MEEVIRFALLGLGVGALYALAAQGLVVVYRGSGVLNFAQGGIGTVGAFVWWELQYENEHSFAFSMTVGVLVAAVIGALTQLLVMRPLRHATPLARLVATLGVLVVLQSLAVLRWGTSTQVLISELPVDRVTFFGDIEVGKDRLILFAIAAGLSLVLWLLYRYSSFGIGTSAVAENQRAAAALGWSPEVIAVINWTLGGALAGASAILIAPIVQLQVSTMTGLMLAAMSAALVAGFRSFPIALVAGMTIGAAQTVLQRYVDTPGLPSALPFAVIVIVLVARGRALPVRGSFLERLPAVGSGRIRPVPALVAVAGAVVVIWLAPVVWVDAMTVTLACAVVLLSVVVLTGYTGQLSLGQFAIAGMGAYVAGRLVDTQGWGFLPAAVAGVLATIPVGVAFALPAVRTRGITLAVVTLGLGSALELMLFNNGDLTGGYAGTNVGSPEIFGVDVGTAAHPERYALVCLVAFVLAALVVANLRRSRTGRRLLAVRTNERAAASLGVRVVATKLYAFAVSSAIAALGGILIAFRSDSIVFTSFASFQSIVFVGFAVVGGIGYVLGPVLGATLAPGAVATAFSDEVLSGVSPYVPLIGGLALVATVLGYQDGLAHGQAQQLRALGRRFFRQTAPTHLPPPSEQVEVRPVEPMTLTMSGLVVRYGAVTAVDHVDLTVRPGAIVGLIGPNGAGKTSVIDAITGFAPVSSGSVRVGGQDVTRASAAARARLGVARSFQALDLFDDLSVLDNLRTASDLRHWSAPIVDLAWPRTPQLSAEVVATVEAFGLGDCLDTLVKDLSYGRRRLLSIARAVAARPSVLLLDEPAAGLGEHESAELADLVRTLPDRWGMAVLLVEHDMNVVMSVCDELVVLNFGATIASGPPAEVRVDPHVIGAYLGTEGSPPDDAASSDEPHESTSDLSVAGRGRE